MNAIIMVGPDPEGLGGISKVVKTWREGSLFADFHVHYIASVTDRSRSKLMDLWWGVISFFKVIFTRGDIVYIHTASDNSFYRKSIFLLISLILRKRVFLHIHSSYFFTFLSELRGGKRCFVFRLLNLTEALVVLTEGIKREIQSLFPAKSIHVLPNPVDQQGLLNRHGITRRKDRLLYLGWYNRLKGVYDLVDAMEILIEKGYVIELDFYGTKEIAELKAYVARKNLGHVIRVNGWADENKKLEALYESTVLILPSHTEGIPNVILEAMATKTPIVSTHVGGLKDVLTDGRNALIAKVGDPVDLSAKIARLLDDEEIREHIAEQAYAEIKEKYDIPVIKEKFRLIFE